MRVSAEDIQKSNQDQADFVVAPAGLYILTGSECNPGYSKDKEGDEDRNRPRLECIWKITGIGKDDVETKENYGNIWDYVSFSKEAGWSRARFGKAVGALPLDAEDDTDFDYDTDDFEGVRVLAKLKVQKGRTKDDPPRNRIQGMWNLEDQAAGLDAAFGGGAEDQESFGEESVFGGGDDSSDEEELTEEQLQGMDLKELGSLAKEYDLDPNDSIVKVKGKTDADKTKAKIIEAILAAASEGGDDEESPF